MDLETWLGMAQHSVDNGNIKAAFEMYEAALQKAPGNIDVLEAYGEMMLHHGDPEAAKRMLLHAVSISPNEGHVKYLNLAQLSQGEEALSHYVNAEQVLLQDVAKAKKPKQRKELQRTLATCKCAVAELYLTDLCDEACAEQACEAAIHAAEMYCKDHIEVHQLRGSLRLSQERPDEAATSLRHAVHLTHTLAEDYQPAYEAKIELGRLLMQVDPCDAFSFFLELLQLDDSNPYVWFLLGESARLKNSHNDAARLLRHARIRVQSAGVGEEALTEIDKSIALLVEAMGGAEAVAHIPHMDEPNPLDYLEDQEETGDHLEEGEEVDDDDEAAWEDVEE